jgi:thioredoxin 1
VVSSIQTITDASFESEVLKSTIPVLVDFWAEWCGPCKMLAPLLEELAGDFDGQLRIAKINADENKQHMQRYSVRGLPSLLLFVDGQERARLVGVKTKTRLASFIENNING